MRTHLVVGPAIFLSVIALSAQPPAAFRIDETTIAQIETAIGSGSLTCRSLVEQYLQRIDAHDKKGAALNAIVQVNDEALKSEILKGIGVAFSNDIRQTPTYVVNGILVDAGQEGKGLEDYVASLIGKS